MMAAKRRKRRRDRSSKIEAQRGPQITPMKQGRRGFMGQIFTDDKAKSRGQGVEGVVLRFGRR